MYPCILLGLDWVWQANSHRLLKWQTAIHFFFASEHPSSSLLVKIKEFHQEWMWECHTPGKGKCGSISGDFGLFGQSECSDEYVHDGKYVKMKKKQEESG